MYPVHMSWISYPTEITILVMSPPFAAENGFSAL